MMKMNKIILKNRVLRTALLLTSKGGSLVIDGGLINVRNDAIGIDALKEIQLTISNAQVRGPGIKGVAIRAGNLKLRNSVVNSSGTGIKVPNQGKMDLGTVPLVHDRAAGDVDLCGGDGAG